MNIEKIRKTRREEKTKRKITSLNLLFDVLNISLGQILEKYNGINFRNTTISKKEVFRQVMLNSISEETINFMKVAEKTVSARQKDKRDPVDYCSDLIFGWLAEDAILITILNKGIPARLQGADCEREFLKQLELDTAPDIQIGDDSNSRLVEVFCDWTDYWNNSGKADLRDNKFNRLVNDNAILLGTAPLSRTGFLINTIDQTHGFVYNPSLFGYGNKPGYTTKEIKKYLKPYNEVIEELCGLFKEKKN